MLPSDFQFIRSSTSLRLPIIRLQISNTNIPIGPRILNETPAALLSHKLFLGTLGLRVFYGSKYT